MLNRFVILSLTFLFISSTKDQINSTLSKPKCNSEFLTIYIEETGPKTPVEPSAITQVLCPSIAQSCCSDSQLLQINRAVTRSHAKVGNLSKILVGLLTRVKDLSDHDRDNLLDVISNASCYYNEGEQKPLSEIVKYLQENHEVIAQNIQTGLNFLSSENSKFGCSVCDQDSHEYISPKEQSVEIRVDYAQCVLFFANEKAAAYLQAFASIRSLLVFYRSLACTKDITLEADTEFFMNTDEVADIISTIKDCATPEKMETDGLCQTLCEEADLVNYNVLYPYVDDILLVSLYQDSLFAQTDLEDLSKEYYSSQMQEVEVKHWLPLLEVFDQVDFIELEYEYGSGWNNLKHAFVENGNEQVKSLVCKQKFII